MSAFRAALLTAAAISFLPVAAQADDVAQRPQMRVDYDQAAVVKLDRAAKTVVVGNPLIADALLVSDKTVYVQGRMFGNTNIIAIDSDGNEVLNTYVTVGAPLTQQVTLYRGPIGQQNMACAPHCERTVTQGDKQMQDMYQDADKKVEVSSKSAELAAQRR
ncbi:MAG: pilus assembly protein N-terminal domain-containing protein [Alphaproteobacteria bacterium]|nr:pilus assembly protein N-terminal domain-containing protein [Alphaproteobacteria bacterium]